ncbi:MAG: hypothetical protein RJA70_2801 [Pseudomonadota bacterium]|jgi:hypothetical protein
MKLLPLLALFGVMSAALPAAANPRPFPFTYHYATSPEGALEVEQFVDYVPVRVSREGLDGTEAVSSARLDLQTELELGLTEHLEAGFYFVFRQAAGATVQPLNFKGIKQRLRYRFAEAGDWPIDTGVYFELGQFHDELEVEEKLLLEKRVGAWRFATNLWLEHEYLFQVPEWKHIYNPTLAVGYELSPAVALGAEYWMHGQLGKRFATSDHFLGPTARLSKGEYWLTAGLYTKVDALDVAPAVDSQRGRMWVRLLLGVGL